MSRFPGRFGRWFVRAGLVGCVWACCAWAWVPLAHAAASIEHPGRFLDRTEALETKDHARFVQRLARIHRENPPLSPVERWHLRYLDAWQTMFEGDLIKSASEFRAVIDHSGNPVLVAKASAQLLSNLGMSRHYKQAFELANHLMGSLSTTTDPKARLMLLANLSQMLNLAGQTDLAVKYARMMESEIPAGQPQCHAYFFELSALYNGGGLTSSSREFRRTIDSCVDAGQPLLANAARLTLSEQYLDEQKPLSTLDILDRIAASVNTIGYFPSRLSTQVQYAMAYAQLGQDDKARKAALAAVAMCRPDYVSDWLTMAYRLLYQVAQKKGDSATALRYYKLYVAHDKQQIDDVSARALAYAMARQQVLAQQLDTERLSKQNRILRLQQALDTKAVENGRLFIALLLMALLFGGFWLLRLKRSQLRFKQLSSMDGLTGTLNHQHFMGEADRVLQAQKKLAAENCLMFIDLDHFKQINDTHGHAVGDAVLKRTVAVCRELLGPSDLFGRLGGEEFAMLLPGCPCERGRDVAERIRAAIEAATVVDEERVVTFSASVGVACTDVSGYEVQHLCRDTDAALYRAKRAGRNRVVVSTAGDDLVEA
ncbi:GGDEF domain-containing protein [Dyella sp. A6]|uniref:GGDEF domain-containing protein n=1 Tax=Dyella aluminiiresistens TaxID=3069105 RepID=UPI002E772B3E|nr:GGDEF domain-containing protein [Dyella sp. A6]